MSDRPGPPPEVVALADARALARAGREFAEADRILAEIGAAGWQVVDRGLSYSLVRAHPPDVVDPAGIRYGWSGSVPSRLDTPPGAPATIVIIAGDDTAGVDHALAVLAAHAMPGTHVVVVGGFDARAVADADRPVETVRTAGPLGIAGAANAGIRRADGRLVVLLDPSLETPWGDVVGPLVGALADDGVAVAGARGLVTYDLRHFDDAPAGDVDAIAWGCLAFRRDEWAARGPLDERFADGRSLAAWWSLVLRDEGEGSPPRRALAVAGLPLDRLERLEPDAGGGPTAATRPDRERRRRRDGYRILDRFGHRGDLARARPAP